MKKLSKELIVQQLDITDCGAACLSSVLRYYGHEKPISSIRIDAGTGKEGTSLLGLTRAAQQSGLEAKAVRVLNKSIQKEDLPAIAHLKLMDVWYHFVVLYDLDESGYLIMDPAKKKPERVSFSTFNERWTGILLLLKPSQNFKHRKVEISSTKRLLSIIYPYRRSLLKVALGAIVYSGLGIATALYIELLADKIIPGGELKWLNIFSGILIILIMIRIISGYLKNLILLRTGREIDRTLINNYNLHILKLPLNFFQSMKTGEILTRINDAIKIRSFINSIAQEIIVNILIVTITLSFMFSYSIKLSLILLLSLPFYFLIYRFLNATNKKYLRAAMEQSAAMESQMVETLKGMSTIKAFLRESRFYRNLEIKCQYLLNTIFKTSKDYSLASHLSELISSLWLLIILWAGARQIMLDAMSYGELFSFYSLYAYITAPLISLILANRGIQDARIAGDRLFQVMDLKTEEKKSNETNSTILKPVFLKFDNVNFSYPGKLRLLRNISFECKPGTITAIAGESGSGKSTLLSLILKFYKPDMGHVYFNNIELEKIALKDLRGAISWIPQDIQLFSGTVEENISMTGTESDAQKIDQCISLCGLNDLINNLPDGINTRITEDGNNFSGGEKQKIALARALYRDSELVLLDEPSSSMDHNSEENLIRILKELKKQGKTILIAAHKISMLSFADQIFIMQNGEIVESGQHSSLLTSEGYYRKLWESNNYAHQEGRTV